MTRSDSDLYCDGEAEETYPRRWKIFVRKGHQDCFHTNRANILQENVGFLLISNSRRNEEILSSRTLPKNIIGTGTKFWEILSHRYEFTNVGMIQYV